MSSTVDKSKVKPDEQYRVDLAKPIKVGRFWVRPGPNVVMKGKVIKEYSDDITAVYPLT